MADLGSEHSGVAAALVGALIFGLGWVGVAVDLHHGVQCYRADHDKDQQAIGYLRVLTDP
jgi:hypothetical protein